MSAAPAATQEKSGITIGEAPPASAGELTAPAEPKRERKKAPASLPVRTSEDQHSPEALIALGIQSGMPVESLEKLMTLARDMRAQRALEAFNEAMAAFQAECPIVRQRTPVFNKPDNQGNKTVRYLYAPLEQIVEDVKTLMTKNGLSYWFETVDEIGTADGKGEHGEPIKIPASYMTTTCVAEHKAGHSKRSSFRVPIEKSGRMSPTQEVGSSSSFAKRYSFCNVFGIIVGLEDDDGRGGSSPPDEKTNGNRQPAREPAKTTDQAQRPAATNQPANAPTSATPPAEKPPTQKLGGEGKQEQQQDYKTLYEKLSDADKKPAKKIGDAICQASGATGSAKTLLDYRESYNDPARKLSAAVLTYLETLFWCCWLVTPREGIPEPPKQWKKRA